MMFKFRNFAVFLGISLFVGCGEVNFDTTPNSTCTEFRDIYGAEACVEGNDGTNTYRYTTRTGDVDLLFVVDNSGSMYAEQLKVADRFPDFLNSIRSLNYQIGIITTDVSDSKNQASAANGMGAFQDGKLLKFPNGRYILSNPNDEELAHQSNQSDFAKTIERNETKNCDLQTGALCPSKDERPIYAMNLAIENSANGDLFRVGGHLAIVVLTDEDERSNGGSIAGYGLEDYDRPDTFAVRSRELLHPTKSVSIHTIAIQPGDQACYDIQNSQSGVKGYFANVLAELAVPSDEIKGMSNLVDGHQGSICSTNYTKEMGSIAGKINDTLGLIQLACPPIEDSLSVGTESSHDFSINLEASDSVRITPPIPPGVNVTIEYKCLK